MTSIYWGERRGRAARSAASPRPHGRVRPALGVLVLGLFVLGMLGGCARPTPGLPNVWPGQAVTPNVQARSGGVIELSISATNDSTNLDYGGASQVRTFTALPAGVTLLGFTSSDVGRLAADDPNRAWVEEIDTKNHVITISFGPLGPRERKTATLSLRVDAPAGTPLQFGTMLAWANRAPDTIECDNECATAGLQAATADNPQLSTYIDDHPEQVQALLKTYQGGGDAVANPLSLSVGDTASITATPQIALLADSHAQAGARLTTKPAFTPGEPVMLWYNLPDDTATYLFRTDALDDGSIIAAIDADVWQAIPATATSITARGQYSDVEALYLFNRR